MLVCPNCNHSNPDGAAQCEACFTPLPHLIACPHCGAQVQDDMIFCGNCGKDMSQAPAPELEAAAAPLEPVLEPEPETPVIPVAPEPRPQPVGATQLQRQSAKLFHVQTETALEAPAGLTVIHIGKPNEKIPPDIDVSGFPHSDVVSRVHADLRLEGDTYYLEDVGSANGTYVNHSPLVVGNRHRLRAGDRISLGKGDLMTFIFQLG